MTLRFGRSPVLAPQGPPAHFLALTAKGEQSPRPQTSWNVSVRHALFLTAARWGPPQCPSAEERESRRRLCTLGSAARRGTTRRLCSMVTGRSQTHAVGPQHVRSEQTANRATPAQQPPVVGGWMWGGGRRGTARAAREDTVWDDGSVLWLHWGGGYAVCE